MRRKINFCVGCLPALVTGLLFFDVQCRADGFAYNDFSAPSSLIFQGDATLVQERLRLTPAERGKAGGVWFSTKQRVKDGFETSFQFQLTKPGGSGANGIAFVIQNNETPLLGLAGHGMGFRGVSNSLVVKFDPYPPPHRCRLILLLVMSCPAKLASRIRLKRQPI